MADPADAVPVGRRGDDEAYELRRLREMQREAEEDPGWFDRQVELIEHRAQALRLRQEFYRQVRDTAEPYVAQGWRLLTGGLTAWSEDGHLKHISFVPEPDSLPLQTHVHARIISPYLYEVATGKPLTRIPPAKAAPVGCVTPVFAEVLYGETDPEATADPAELLRQRRPVVELGPGTAPGWLVSALELAVRISDELSNDRSMRDWLVQGGPTHHCGPHYECLRMACLLTKHLGDEGRLPALLWSAEEAWRVSVDRQAQEGFPRRNFDRQRRIPLLWSHDRWVRHFDSTPP